ncbi:hypothetical protein, partial [uncultured Akkermansia sp.]|uniref:hypothetical protein n=1 Tax=uncultured Akkermansia sp. TaxID=512294 RepID=UPI00265CE3C1
MGYYTEQSARKFPSGAFPPPPSQAVPVFHGPGKSGNMGTYGAMTEKEAAFPIILHGIYTIYSI